jgi:enoyl-CoA hydratase/carnithine racemase
MEEVLLVETRGAVRLLTLNRPKKLNALNADLLKALTEALLAVQHDERVAAVIIAGAGRAFCPGMDTSVPRVLTTESRRNLVRHADESTGVFKLLARIDKPVIAPCTATPWARAAAWRSAAIWWSPPKARASDFRSCGRG